MFHSRNNALDNGRSDLAEPKVIRVSEDGGRY